MAWTSPKAAGGRPGLGPIPTLVDRRRSIETVTRDRSGAISLGVCRPPAAHLIPVTPQRPSASPSASSPTLDGSSKPLDQASRYQDAEGESGRARRAWFRVPVEVPVRFLTASGRWEVGATANLSAGGLLLCCRCLPGPGLEQLIRDHIEVSVELQLPDGPLRLTGQVIWGGPPEHGSPWFRLGMSFVAPTQEQQAAVEAFLKGQVTNTRPLA